ncbi:hypothetical protein TKK_0016644 [Trichogramma kaykai]
MAEFKTMLKDQATTAKLVENFETNTKKLGEGNLIFDVLSARLCTLEAYWKTLFDRHMILSQHETEMAEESYFVNDEFSEVENHYSHAKSEITRRVTAFTSRALDGAAPSQSIATPVLQLSTTSTSLPKLTHPSLADDSLNGTLSSRSLRQWSKTRRASRALGSMVSQHYRIQFWTIKHVNRGSSICQQTRCLLATINLSSFWRIECKLSTQRTVPIQTIHSGKRKPPRKSHNGRSQHRFTILQALTRLLDDLPSVHFAQWSIVWAHVRSSMPSHLISVGNTRVIITYVSTASVSRIRARTALLL